MNSTNTNTNTTNKNNISIMTEEQIKQKYLKGNILKLQLAKLATIIMIIAALFYTTIFNPVKIASRQTVYDEDKILSSDTIDAIESRNAILNELTDTKIIVVVQQDKTSYNDLEKKTGKLFDSYKAGDGGILFAVNVPKSKSSGIGDSIGEFFDDLFGGGTQPYAYRSGRNLGDSSKNEIDAVFRDYFEKSYSEGNYNSAILDTFNALADYFDGLHKINSRISEPDNGSDVPQVSVSTYDPNGSGVPNYSVSETIAVNTVDESKSSVKVTFFGLIIVFVIFFMFIMLGSMTQKKSSGVTKVYKKPFWFGGF